MALTSLRYLSLKEFKHSVKACNKFTNLFFLEFHLKYCRAFSSDNINVFDTVQMQKYLNFLVQKNSHNNSQSVEKIVKLLKDKIKIEEELKVLENISSECDKDFKKMIESEKKKYSENIQKIKHDVFYSLLPPDNENDSRNVELRVERGIGGEEARLFSEELFQMYINYAEYKNWEHYKGSDFVLISGEFVFGHLKYEAGVHRVQRVPATEKSGRTHTSTCSVTVLPQPYYNEIQIKSKDLIVEKTKSSGPGGQNINKRETCVRIRHKPTGIVIENQTERHQDSNLNKAIDRLRGILFNMEQEKLLNERKTLRKQQAGLNDYSDKIRTYHYSHNRVTDHRINYTTHNLRGFLEGNKELDWMINKVKEHNKKKELFLHIENILQSEDYKNFEKHQSK